MNSYDSAIIKAFFTQDEIHQAQQLSAQSALTQPAAGVFCVDVDGFEVQVDGFTFPGCTSCGCEAFKSHRSCKHTCFGVALMLKEDPSIQGVLWPDTNAAIDASQLEPDSYYELKMLPLTYSPSCQAGRTFVETVLDKAEQCRGEVDDEQIAKEVVRLFDDYFEMSAEFGPEVSESELSTLINLLHSLGVSDEGIRALIEHHPEYSKMFSWHWWPSSWRRQVWRPYNWRPLAPRMWNWLKSKLRRGAGRR